MAYNKKALEQLGKYIFYFYLILFPFGQLISQEILFLGKYVRIHPVDVLAGLSIPIWLITRGSVKALKRLYPVGFVYISGFSLAVSLYIFQLNDLIVGLLYLLRLIAYITMPFMIYYLIQRRIIKREEVTKMMIAAVLMVGIFGWIQYVWFYDLRFLKVFGWDDHYYRLVSTFIDPTFTSIILIFGLLISTVLYFEKRRKILLGISGFLLMSIAFTYARAGYVALIFGFLYIFYYRGMLKRLVICLILAIPLVFLLPRPSSEGVKLERMHSIYSKLSNYKETIQIIEKNPLFGIGFNNMCLARNKYVKTESPRSHSCSGSDSSLLFVFATTGVSGFLLFANMLRKLVKKLGNGTYSQIFKSCGVALMIHSLFVNSLFYPWVIGLMGVLFAISIRQTRN